MKKIHFKKIIKKVGSSIGIIITKEEAYVNKLKLGDIIKLTVERVKK